MEDEKPYMSPLSDAKASVARFIAVPDLGDAIKTQVLKGAGVGLLTKGLTAGVGFVCQVLLARMMGVTEFGLLVYALTWANVLSILPKCGLDLSIVRYVAEYRARQEWGKLAGIIVLGARISLLGGFAAAAISALLIYFLKDELGYHAFIGLLLALAALPLLAANSLRLAALRGLKRIFLAEFPDGVLRPFLLTAIIASIWAVTAISALQVLAVNLGVLAIVFVIGGYWLACSMPVEVRQAVPEYRVKEWIKVSGPLMGIAGMQMAMSQVDVLMVGTILDTEQAGVYAAGARLSDIVVLGLAGVNSIAAPMISELYHTGRKRELQHVITLATRSGIVVTVLASMFLVVMGEKVLWLFGSQFVAAYQAMLFLVVGQVVNACCGPVGLLASMTGHEREASFIMGAALAIDIILNVALVPSFGLTGASCATAVSVAFWNVALMILSRKRLALGV